MEFCRGVRLPILSSSNAELLGMRFVAGFYFEPHGGAFEPEVLADLIFEEAFEGKM